jgi:putative tricarboxylic transport membrane protein
MVSFIGGMFSYLVLIFLAPVVAKVALKFGPFEYWAISIFSLSMIITVSGKSLAKGLISAMIGMMLATSGRRPSTPLSAIILGSTSSTPASASSRC